MIHALETLRASARRRGERAAVVRARLLTDKLEQELGVRAEPVAGGMKIAVMAARRRDDARLRWPARWLAELRK